MASADHTDEFATARFDEMYESTPPWETGKPQPVIVELQRAGLIFGSVLDVGCGTGENAIHLAQHGYDVLGIDAAPKAIDLARQKAANRKSSARFQVHDALALETLGEAFDTAIDSGMFHVFSDQQRIAFVKGLSTVVRPGGAYHLICFSEHETREGGPRRVTQREIRDVFTSAFSLESVEPTHFEATIFKGGAAAWHATLRRRCRWDGLNARLGNPPPI